MPQLHIKYNYKLIQINLEHPEHILKRGYKFYIFFLVYKIPYRRAPRLACRVRRASKGRILHTNFFPIHDSSAVGMTHNN